jgi:hypothetical protein
MKRWAIAKLGDWEDDGSISPKLSLYPCNRSNWTKQGFGWAFCKFSAKDLTAIQADPDIYVLPDGVMDMSVGSIPTNVRNTMKTRLEAAGFVFTDVKTTWTVRQLLNYLAQQIQPEANVESVDVADLS